MTCKSMATVAAAFVVLAAVLGGCQSGSGEIASPVFYPPPPDPPRLQFLTSFSNAEEWTTTRSSFRDLIVGKESDDSDSTIKAPYGLAVHDGRLYVCDLGNHCVHVVDFAHKTYRKLGQPGQIKNPVNIRIGPSGNRYVCDTLVRQVLVFDAQDRYVRSLGDPTTCSPCDVAFGDKELYVADIQGGEVEIWSPEGKFLRLLAAKGKAPDELLMPTNLASGPDGRLYVVDTASSIIKIYTPDGKFAGLIGGPGDTPGYFARPKGLAVDPQGLLYVADAQWEVIQLFDPRGRLLMFFGQSGQAPDSLGMPAGLAIDASSLPYFSRFVQKDFRPEYLLFVANQFGHRKIGVYAFGRSTTADYSTRAAPTTRPAKSGS